MFCNDKLMLNEWLAHNLAGKRAYYVQFRGWLEGMGEIVCVCVGLRSLMRTSKIDTTD